MGRSPITLTLSIFIIFFTSQPAVSQDSSSSEHKINLTAQIRTRAEYRDGAFKPLSKGEKAAALVSQRTRLTFNYLFNDKLELRISPQSVSIWGQTNIVQGVENSGNQFSLFEAWAKLKLNKNTNIKIGRQVISLDDERFFGSLDWAQGGRAHDALSLNAKQKKIEVQLILAYNQNYKELYGNNLNNTSGTLFTAKDASPYKWMQTLWTNIAIYKEGRISLLANNLGFQNAANNQDSSKVHFMQTFGANWFHKGKQFSATVSGYLQIGKTPSDQKSEAYLVSTDVNYKLSSKLTIGVGSDLLSGTEVGTHQSKNTSFIPYFGTNHKFYGSMDYYYVSSAHKNSGLWDNYFYSSIKRKKLSASLRFHQFFSPSSIKDSVRTYSGNLGQEVDLDFIYPINKFCSLAGGYSLYSTTASLNFLKSTVARNDLQHWIWLTLNISPTLFNSKYKNVL